MFLKLPVVWISVNSEKLYMKCVLRSVHIWIKNGVDQGLSWSFPKFTEIILEGPYWWLIINFLISDNVTNEQLGYSIAISGGSVLSCGHLFAELQINGAQRLIWYKGHCTVKAGENLTSTKYTYEPCKNGEMILFIYIS